MNQDPIEAMLGIPSAAEPAPAAKDESMAEALDALGDLLDKPAVHRFLETYHAQVANQAEQARRQLDAQREAQAEQAKLIGSNRWFFLAHFCMGAAVLLSVLYLFRDKEQVLMPIVTATIGFIGGISGGWVARSASK